MLGTKQSGFALLEIFLEDLFGREGDRGALVLAFEVLIVHQPLADDADVEVRIRHLPDLPRL